MDRILVADDDPALRGLMRLVARRCGFAVDVASNGKDALDKIRDNDYMIVLIDLMMPVMNGYDVIDRLRGMRQRPAVVVVTAMSESCAHQLDSGVVQSIIRKPFDIDLLQGVLRELAAALRDARASSTITDGIGAGAC